MAKNETTRRMRILGRKARRGKATESELAELTSLESNFYSPTPSAQSIYDLPIARRMWAKDSREVER